MKRQSYRKFSKEFKIEAVSAYQYGDGFPNIITPTSGVLMAVLGVAGVPYGRWIRFVFPLFLL